MKSHFSSLIPFVGTVFCLLSTQTVANENSALRYSLGTGLPYFLNLEVGSYSDESGLYLNLGQGPDAGLHLGWEQVVSDNKKHSLGLVLGAVGVRHDDTKIECDDEDSGAEQLGCVIGKALASSLDYSGVYGLGASYGYSISGLYNEPGWKVRFIAGYGEQRESKRNVGSASISLRYQF